MNTLVFLIEDFFTDMACCLLLMTKIKIRMLYGKMGRFLVPPFQTEQNMKVLRNIYLFVYIVRYVSWWLETRSRRIYFQARENLTGMCKQTVLTLYWLISKSKFILGYQMLCLRRYREGSSSHLRCWSLEAFFIGIQK